MKKYGAILAAGVLSLAMIGCNGGSTASSTTGSTTGASAGNNSGKRYRIAVIPKGATHDFWKSIHAGAEDAAKELGNVDVDWKGPQKEDDLDAQISVVEDFTSKGVDGIVLAPLDDTALGKPVTDAQNANIPVLIIDSDLKTAKTVSFVATDNYKGGQMAGDYMVKLLNGKGRIVVLRYQEGSASTMNREKGFLDEIKKSPGIQVLSDNQWAGPTVETAQKASENLLARFRKPDGSLDLDGIYCPNESSTFGMLNVLRDNKWNGKVKFVGFDSSPKLVEGLQKGDINGLVVQDPHKMGYLGVKTLMTKITGGTVEPKIDTGATLVTKENMDQPDVAKLLAPPQI